MVDHWPVMIKHSLWSRASVKRRETMSSGLIRKRISSWTRPELVTPPPTNWLAKSTWKLKQMNYSKPDGPAMHLKHPLILYHMHLFLWKETAHNIIQVKFTRGFSLTMKYIASLLDIRMKTPCERVSAPFFFYLRLSPRKADWEGGLRCSHYSRHLPPMPKWVPLRGSTSVCCCQ